MKKRHKREVRPRLRGGISERDHDAAYYFIYRRCVEAGDDPEHTWTEQSMAEVLGLAAYMCAPPRRMPPSLTRKINALMTRYHVADSWPRETHQRVTLLERMKARIEVEMLLDIRDPERVMIQRPASEFRWAAVIDRALQLRRQGMRIDLEKAMADREADEARFATLFPDPADSPPK